MSGANEVPANTSTGTGAAVFTLIGGQLLYRVDLANIQDVTRGHIHGPAAAGVNAGIRLPFFELPGGGTPIDFGATSSTLVSGVATLPTGVSMDSLLVLMRNGNSYVNIHTSAIPGGEVRGQVTRP